MVNYTWSITKLDTVPTYNNLSNVVRNIYWNLLATKEYQGTSYSTSCGGYITVDFPSEQNFVPYNQLTSETTLDWVKSFLGLAQVSSLEESLSVRLDDTIDLINNPPYVNLPLPWEST